MKKFSSYILILLIFVGLFGPLTKIHAADPPLGTCTVTASKDEGTVKKGDPVVLPDKLSETDCRSFASFSGWVADPASGAGTDPQAASGCVDWLGVNLQNCFGGLLGYVSYIILEVMSMILGLAGLLLNYVINTTVVNMATNVGNLTGINTAWKVIRDIMNIAFIFLLVYEAIKVIIAQSTTDQVKKFITGIVLASILINFSLFFTKLLIDASNVITIGIYNSIIGDTTVNLSANNGLSNAYMQSLGLQNAFSSSAIGSFQGASGGNYSMLIIGILGSVLFLVTAFVFLAVSVLFVVRYIVLLILLMLSPIAYMGMAMPKIMMSYEKEWWESLWGQLFFGPIFMLMTWVIITLMNSPNFISASKTVTIGQLTTGAAQNPDSVALLFNFTVVIGLTIAALVVAKKQATRGASQIRTLTNNATKFAGTAFMGGSAKLLRGTVGVAGNAIASSADLQDAAKNKTGFAGGLARATLYGSRTARDSTFDIRNATIPTNVIGDAIQGTVGRTRTGKALGLNDVNIPGIGVGAMINDETGFGPGGTKGYAANKKDSEKRVRDRETADATELAEAQAEKAVNDGKGAAVGTPAYDAMEKALSKLTDKQTEALVAGNRDLLNSQNFANTISVKQLEALNKSDQFSESEKDSLKDKRFADINAAMATGTPAAVSAVRTKIRGLSDSELEMIDPAYFAPTPAGQEFVSHLKSGQVETVNKSSKFTTSQKTNLGATRKMPLTAALAAGNVAAAEAVVRGLGVKEIASLDMVVLSDPTMMETYTGQILKRVAPEMNPADIPILRTAILTLAPTSRAATWLATPDGIASFS